MHDSFQAHQTRGAHHPQGVGEQFSQFFIVGDPEIRKAMVIDYLQSCQPLKCRIIRQTPADLPRRAYASAVGINPQTDQEPGVPHRSAGHPLHRFDRLLVRA